MLASGRASHTHHLRPLSTILDSGSHSAPGASTFEPRAKLPRRPSARSAPRAGGALAAGSAGLRLSLRSGLRVRARGGASRLGERGVRTVPAAAHPLPCRAAHRAVPAQRGPLHARGLAAATRAAGPQKLDDRPCVCVWRVSVPGIQNAGCAGWRWTGRRSPRGRSGGTCSHHPEHAALPKARRPLKSALAQSADAKRQPTHALSQSAGAGWQSGCARPHPTDFTRAPVGALFHLTVARPALSDAKNHMATTPYIPNPDSQFDSWLANFASVLAGSPGTYFLTAGDAAAVTAAQASWATAYAASQGATRGPATISAKDTARVTATQIVRPYAVGISLNPGIANSDKVAIGVTVRSTVPTPVPAPTTQPDVLLESAAPGVANLRFRDHSTPSQKSKPFGVLAMQVWVNFGTVPATDPSQCKFVQNVTKTPFQLDTTGNAGKVCTVFGRWATRSGPAGVAQTGPWSTSLVFNVV